MQDIKQFNSNFRFFCFNNITPIVILQKKLQKEKQILQRFFSPSVIEQIFLDHTSEKLETQLEQVKGSITERLIVFIDLRNSTKLSMEMEPNQFANILNRFAEIVCDYVLECSGIVHKILGDGILITLDKNQANVLPKCFMNIYAKFQKDIFLKDLSFGVTCHFDNVFMGYIGSKNIIDYTVLGDGVNLTFKLQELAKKLFYPIIITEKVMDFLSIEKDFYNFSIKKFDNIYLENYKIYFNIYGLQFIDIETNDLSDYGSCNLPSKDNSLR